MIVDQYLVQLNNHISQRESDTTKYVVFVFINKNLLLFSLFSDEWIRELQYQRPPLPLTNIDFNRPITKKIKYTRTST